MSNESVKKKSKREGRRIRSLYPMAYVAPYIMVERNDACNYIEDTVTYDFMEEYIRKKRAEGLKGFGMMHLFLAAYVRTVSQYPGINRFLRGQKIYARNCIEVMITIKKELKLNCPDTVIKLYFPPDATADDVFHIVDDTIKKAREDNTGFDGLAKAINYIPGLFLKLTVFNIKLFDYFGLLPRALTKLSPFHAGLAITNMGSLGIPPIYHHLYNFGNTTLFIAFGARYSVSELQPDGTVKAVSKIDYKIVTDERVCDGHYYAAALKYVKKLLTHPELLETKPEQVVEDIP